MVNNWQIIQKAINEGLKLKYVFRAIYDIPLGSLEWLGFRKLRLMED